MFFGYFDEVCTSDKLDLFTIRILRLVEKMESGQKCCTLDIDECDLYRPKGFTTVALAHNEEIGRLCAIRKLDQR